MPGWTVERRGTKGWAASETASARRTERASGGRGGCAAVLGARARGAPLPIERLRDHDPGELKAGSSNPELHARRLRSYLLPIGEPAHPVPPSLGNEAVERGAWVLRGRPAESDTGTDRAPVFPVAALRAEGESQNDDRGARPASPYATVCDQSGPILNVMPSSQVGPSFPRSTLKVCLSIRVGTRSGLLSRSFCSSALR